jgi:hypothetical protein
MEEPDCLPSGISPSPRQCIEIGHRDLDVCRPRASYGWPADYSPATSIYTSDDIFGDGMPLQLQGLGKMRQAPRRPQQGLRRRSARVRFDQTLQIVDEAGLMHDFFLRPPPLRLCL